MTKKARKCPISRIKRRKQGCDQCPRLQEIEKLRQIEELRPIMELLAQDQARRWKLTRVK